MLQFNTLKHGYPRRHRIPTTLVPYLKEYSLEANPLSDSTMDRLFHEIMGRIGVKIRSHDRKKRAYTGRLQSGKGLNWHAFRHSLDNALHEAGIDEPTIDAWFGWKTKSTMARYYYTARPSDADAKVLERHPFIPLWE